MQVSSMKVPGMQLFSNLSQRALLHTWDDQYVSACFVSATITPWLQGESTGEGMPLQHMPSLHGYMGMLSMRRQRTRSLDPVPFPHTTTVCNDSAPRAPDLLPGTHPSRASLQRQLSSPANMNSPREMETGPLAIVRSNSTTRVSVLQNSILEKERSTISKYCRARVSAVGPGSSNAAAIKRVPLIAAQMRCTFHSFISCLASPVNACSNQ